jgi:hypothetical protein
MQSQANLKTQPLWGQPESPSNSGLSYENGLQQLLFCEPFFEKCEMP